MRTVFSTSGPDFTDSSPLEASLCRTFGTVHKTPRFTFGPGVLPPKSVYVSHHERRPSTNFKISFSPLRGNNPDFALRGWVGGSFYISQGSNSAPPSSHGMILVYRNHNLNLFIEMRSPAGCIRPARWSCYTSSPCG